MSYKMNSNESKKIIYVSAWDTISPEEGAKFIAEFTEITKGKDTSNYYLLLDGKKLKVSQEDSAALLENLLNMYTSLSFKARYITTFDSPIAQSQFKRLSKGTFNKSFITVETLADAEKEIK